MKRRVLLLALLCGIAPGCTLLGYHKYTRAPRAPPEEAAKVRYPSSLDSATRLDGPAMAALEIAMNDFMPPGSKATGDDEQMSRCLSRRDTYDVAVTKVDDIYFVFFTPQLSRCGITPINIPLDIGGAYAIDSQGRILDSD